MGEEKILAVGGREEWKKAFISIFRRVEPNTFWFFSFLCSLYKHGHVELFFLSFVVYLLSFFLIWYLCFFSFYFNISFSFLFWWYFVRFYFGGLGLA